MYIFIQARMYIFKLAFLDIPPLKDTIESLQQCEETFFGYFLEEELCGVISFKMNENVLDIHRLIVHPDHFRKGIAQLLLNFVECQFKGITSLIVTTGAKNRPAIKFYEKNGFIKTEEMIVNECLALSSFEKKTS
ncbi:GNAT family N-acetyltransferase [Neobacillus sp. D3-1R]|uniref:GNAT family N-acetyltransferase n=1 Tax=Neobacillus sp. D3-1R TaxID=3445778 RepID=UPI003F9FF978